MKQKKHLSGFSLIELLVVLAIMGIVVTLSAVGLFGAREVGRDGKRKSDLETIRSGIELYRADCGKYPTTLPAPTNPLRGSGVTTCLSTNTYIQSMPDDPIAGRDYSYTPSGLPNPTSYALCAALEGATGTAVGCGSCGTGTCNYKVTNQ